MSTQHNGWVALSERRPTEQDADDDGYVPVIEKTTGRRTSCALTSLFMADGKVSHFFRVPPPPETEEQKRARLDEEARVTAWLSMPCVTDTGKAFTQGWQAALRHARQPEARP